MSQSSAWTWLDYNKTTSIAQKLGSHYSRAIWKKKSKGCIMHDVDLYTNIHGKMWWLTVQRTFHETQINILIPSFPHILRSNHILVVCIMALARYCSQRTVVHMCPSGSPKRWYIEKLLDRLTSQYTIASLYTKGVHHHTPVIQQIVSSIVLFLYIHTQAMARIIL